MITLHCADCLKILRGLSENSVDSLVTDPPAGISFMGKDWDHDRGGRDGWIAWMQEVMAECLRVLKPGAHGLVWALPRTSHWTATALENAGFEVRDVVNHIFGTGFPKSLNIGKAIDKAAGAVREISHFEKRPVLPKGRGNGRDANDRPIEVGIFGASETHNVGMTLPATPEAKQWDGWGTALKPAHENWILVRKPLGESTVAANVLKHGTGGLNIDAARNIGRWPSNLILSEEAAADLDQHSGHLCGPGNKSLRDSHAKSDSVFGMGGGAPTMLYDRGGSASRFFYCAKASKSDKGADNKHPTCKNTKLMEYLITLVTPPGGIVLDPFMGSGSTGVAAKRLGFDFLGIEQSQDYFQTAEKRLLV